MQTFPLHLFLLTTVQKRTTIHLNFAATLKRGEVEGTYTCFHLKLENTALDAFFEEKKRSDVHDRIFLEEQLRYLRQWV